MEFPFSRGCSFYEVNDQGKVRPPAAAGCKLLQQGRAEAWW